MGILGSMFVTLPEVGYLNNEHFFFHIVASKFYMEN